VLGYDQSGAHAVAIFSGASNRQLQSPFSLTQEAAEPDLPAALAVGQFTGDKHADVAALAVSDTLQTRLWLAPSTGNGALSSATAWPTEVPLTDQIAPCTASLVPIDLDSDGKEELLIVGEPLGMKKQGTRILVARSKLDGGGDAWELDEPIDLEDVKLSNHFFDRALCRAYAFNEDPEETEGKAGYIEVGDVDASGKKDLVALTFVVTGEGPEQVLQSSLVVFPEAQLSAAAATPIALPPDVHPVMFALLNADADPELEIAYYALSGAFVADIDLNARALTNVVQVDTGGFATLPSELFLLDPPVNAVSGDFNGDGIPDIAMGFLSSTQVYYGVPVKP
jgi:hypothetical protein